MSAFAVSTEIVVPQPETLLFLLQGAQPRPLQELGLGQARPLKPPLKRQTI
jgi:hypothetical protein